MKCSVRHWTQSEETVSVILVIHRSDVSLYQHYLEYRWNGLPHSLSGELVLIHKDQIQMSTSVKILQWPCHLFSADAEYQSYTDKNKQMCALKSD